MELAVYIRNLLYNHDQVVIPGLGTLRTRYKPAEVNASEHVITPPSKYLVFESNSNSSDNTLADAIAEEKSVGKISAKEFVKEQVAIISKKLSAGETIFLEGIGYFSEQNGIIRFDREPGVNFLTDSYGLAQVEYKLSETAATLKQKPETTLSEKKRNYTPVLVTAGIVILLIAAAFITFLYYPGVFRIKKNQQPIAVMHQEEPDTLSSSVNDTLKNDSINEVFDSATNKKNALSLPPEKTEIQTSESISYYIIAGSFKTYERATILSKQLEKEGYKPEVIKFDENLYRVSLGDFKNKEQGAAELEKIRSVKGKDAVWMLAK